MGSEVPLRWRNIDTIPLIHGRVPFAIAVREQMLARKYVAVAVELPPSLRRPIFQGIRRLPRIHAVVYREPAYVTWDAGSEESPSRRLWYVTIDPCDAIIEALRIVERDRTAAHFVDAEVEGFEGNQVVLPDSFAVLGMGVEKYYGATLDSLRRLHPPSAEDERRERHMAARLFDLSQQTEARGDVLFLCGMAHWERIHGYLKRRGGQLETTSGPEEGNVGLVAVPEPMQHSMLGESPYATAAYEKHRSSIELSTHDAIHAVKELLLDARDRYDRGRDQSTLERATPSALATVLNFARKLTLHNRRLTPDLYTLVVAAKGVIGNDFALSVLETARGYPSNRGVSSGHDDIPDGLGEDFEPASPGESLDDWLSAAEPEDSNWRPEGDSADDELLTEWVSRTPGERRHMKRIALEDKPPAIDQQRWRTAWNPYSQCSWPPEDLVIENLRSYVSSRCLSLAGIDRIHTEEFTASLKDGLAIRETLRDLHRRKLHVKVEPRVPGRVAAVVLIFEEDDAGTRYPWRTTWMAEHPEESTLAFYATQYMDDIVGPGIGRASYGGCMFLYPPIAIPDVWEDMLFEKARTPSERLLLAAVTYAQERFVAHVAARPPSANMRATAEALGRHIVHIPLSSFSARTLEKVRRVHVLNGQEVRSFAARFIR